MPNQNFVAGVVMLVSGLASLVAPPVGHAVIPRRAGSQAPILRQVTIVARRYGFEPPSIDVHVGDIIRITLVAEDIPHSFALDEYRICKRAAPGRSVTFEFLADRPGRFTFYCDLKAEEGCRAMRGTLAVGCNEPARVASPTEAGEPCDGSGTPPR